MDQQLEKIEVRAKIVVNVSPQRAFDAFTLRCHQWWPGDYKLGKTDRTAITIEPFEGGRWYETGKDSLECDWGKVLVWDPPRRILFAWQISPDFTPEHDPEKSSRVDVRFTWLGPNKTAIELVHSEFEHHGEGWQAMRNNVARKGGWADILKQFSSTVE